MPTDCGTLLGGGSCYTERIILRVEGVNLFTPTGDLLVKCMLGLKGWLQAASIFATDISVEPELHSKLVSPS